MWGRLGSVDSFASIKKPVDVSVRRNIWDCGAQAQDKCGRAGVGWVKVALWTTTLGEIRRNQFMHMGDANDPSQTVRVDITSRSLV